MEKARCLYRNGARWWTSAPAHSTAPVINPSESPLFQTVDSGRTNFTCIVSGADTIGWIVDDIDANDRRISVIRHIEMYDLETIDDTLRMFRQVISVPNSCMNNRTELVCVAENIVGDDVRSSPVVLIIEGCHTSLSKEKATTEAVDNNTTFHLSESLSTKEPPTLSSGAIAGICIGVIVTVALCVLIAVGFTYGAFKLKREGRKCLRLSACKDGNEITALNIDSKNPQY